jgi:hypothetical protein
MKALTIYQPWASLVIVGAKPYEFRGWSPRERGGAYADLIGQRVGIHSSTRKIDRNEVLAIKRSLTSGDAESIAETCLHADKAMPVLEEALKMTHNCSLPFGCLLGTAILGEPRNGYDIAEEFGVQSVNDSDRDEHANFGWPMLDIERWDEPVPMRGFQGFWNIPTPETLGL